MRTSAIIKQAFPERKGAELAQQGRSVGADLPELRQIS
jgi:hypothetical protein